MEIKWPRKKIGDFALVKGGKRLPAGSVLLNQLTRFPYIRLVDIANNRISSSSMLYLDENTRNKISRYIVQENDVCLAIVGHTIGLVFYVEKNWDRANLTENAARITALNGVNSKFLFYYLLSPYGQEQIKARVVGSAQGKLPLYSIQSIEVPILPITQQKAIVDLLSAIDDKFKLNRQMNETIESLARAIFKSWFVDFNPVRAKMEGSEPYGMDAETAALFPDSFEDSVLGDIPKGWVLPKTGGCKTREKLLL